ncbi:alpha/beta hydrolase [Moraxella oblonga]|uniref:alpha/beta hydrolase n=1 Tax=Moraxella oblonga TaxID=200413 RepID=UPI000832CCB9|nr:alpha/beta hydrolase [Moraxella oblonga]
MQNLRFYGVFAVFLVLSACTTLPNNKTAQAKLIQSARTNISTTTRLSDSTQSVLLSSGYTQEECVADFDKCLQSVDELFFNEKNKFYLAVIAELHYAHALYLQNHDDCRHDFPPFDDYYANAPLDEQAQKQRQLSQQQCFLTYVKALNNTINYSYAHLFYDNLTGDKTAMPIAFENDIKAQDLYHVASHALIDEVYKKQYGAFAFTKANHAKADGQNLSAIGHLLDERYQMADYVVNLHVIDNNDYFHSLYKGEDTVSELISIYDSRLANLQTVNTRSGIGVGYVGVLADRYATQKQPKTDEKNRSKAHDDPATRIYPIGHVLLTGVAKPQGKSLDEVLNSHTLDVYFFNPYDNKSVEILGQNYPLFVNYSASYAMWLKENDLDKVGLSNMLQKQEVSLPELFMLEPYNPDKKVVILVHGLASSPATWVNFTNNLLADPILRDNYQVWQIFYSTNLPMLENRYQIQKLIETAYAKTDPEGKHKASKNSILIGHSMGGVISRMMLSDDDLWSRLDEIDEKTQDNQVKKLLTQTYQDEFLNRFSLRALPQVDTAVFISSPFRGTDYAERWFTRMARRIIRLPLDLTQVVVTPLVNLGEDEVYDSTIGSLYLHNGASQLSDRSAFMALTKDIQINDKVRYYSVMGNHKGKLDNGDVAGVAISDGIVPYESSHLEGAEREIIITGGHSIHENPKTVRELRKILHEHLMSQK